MILRAPLAFVGAISTIGFGLWWFISWGYERQILGLRATIEAKNAVIAMGKGHEKILSERIEEYRERLHLVPAINRYEQMSTTELIKAANNLAAKLRKEDEAWRLKLGQRHLEGIEDARRAKTEEEKNKILARKQNALVELSGQQREKWEKEFKSEAILLREEMLSRIPEETKESMEDMHELYSSGAWFGDAAIDLYLLAKILSK